MGKKQILSSGKQKALGCLAVVGLSVFVLTASATKADAQTRATICRSLNSQLASLSSSRSSGGNSADYRKYDNAAQSQQIQITKTKRIAQRGRCTGLGLFNSKSAQCRRIVSSLKKMEANLRGLKNKRAQFAPRQDNSSRTRNRILRQIEQNRCRTNTQQARAEQPAGKTKRRTLLEQIFGVKTYKEDGQREQNNDVETKPSFSGMSTYRTLCVRKTDGYYFPISFSTVKDRFPTDQATCQSMCPGTKVELYHHKMPTEDSEEMVSYLTGKAYAQEPFAFAYRKSVDLDQKCRFATQNRIEGIETASVDKQEKSTRIGIPVFREDPALSPDDHDIQRDKISFEKAGLYLKDTRSSEDGAIQNVADNRKIRIVGPAFFPVQ